jgi:hypothetical protein
MKYLFQIILLLSSTFSFSQTLSTSFVAKAKYSNKQVVWYEYEYWLDGSKLSDRNNSDKFNDILFKRVGNKYYRAQVEGAYNVKDWGVKDEFEKGNVDENSRHIQEMLDYFPEGYTASIYVPTGSYHFSKTIQIRRRPYHIFGDNGTIFSSYNSRLNFPAGIEGIVILREGQSIQETIIERLCIVAEAKTQLVDGIAVRSRVKIRDCTVKGFANNGIGIFANMEEGNDASGSVIEGCHSLENGNDGFFGGRVDGNAILFINCDARDNGRFGFNDDSFLGNNFISCMAHYNKGGDYYVRDRGNAKSMFIACYSEGGNKISRLAPKSTVVGGIWGTGYTKDDGKTILY